MTLLSFLKQQTQPFHAALERQLRIETRCHSRAAYQAVLACFYGFYLPVEARLARVPGLESFGLDLDRRWKAPLLAADLATLGLSSVQLAALPRCAALPMLPTAAAGLGCLYVLEGATLGGQVIARQVAPRLAFADGRGCTFFSSYGREVGPMWRAFGAVLTASVTSAQGTDEAVAAAGATFAALQHWIEETLDDDL